MEKTILGLFVLILSLSFVAAFASPSELQNKELNANLADGRQIHFQFTDELYPIIDNGYVAGNSQFSLVDTPLRIYQNGFLITMPEQGWFMAGTKSKSGDYSTHLYEWTGKQFRKTVFSASLQDIKIVEAPVTIEKGYASTGIPPETKKDLIILVDQDMRNYWKDNYDIDVKVFDKKLNPNPKFLDTFGAVNDAVVKVTLATEDGSEKEVITGKTAKVGICQLDYVIPDNKKIGKYVVNVEAEYQGSKAAQSVEMFIFGLGQTSTTESS